MNKFYLKKLSIYGEGKTPSYMDFEKGLNIIHGISDTGKTCILKCIDFVFGSSNKYPIPESHGYDLIQLLINTSNGSLTLKRELGKNKISVLSSDENFNSGDYSLKEIGEILLPLVGIKNKPTIIKNSRYEKQRLTWRTFMHSFIISEEEIIQTQPILMSKESTAKTASISALIYLISALNFDDINPQEDKKIKEARKKAVEIYINKEISNLSLRQNELTELLKNFDQEYAENIIKKLTGELTEIEKAISEEMEKQNSYLSKIVFYKDKITECDIRLNKFEEFNKQCTADIERLGFIVDAENNIEKIPVIDKCPYCDNDIPHKKHESYTETANNELKRILELINGLSKTIYDAQKEKEKYEIELKNALTKKKYIDDYIKNALKPKQQNIEKTLNDYKIVLKLQNEMDLLQKLQADKYVELTKLSEQDKSEVSQYKPKEHFPIDFENDFSNIFTNILKECKYENLNTSVFNLENFDAIINSKEKSNFGKGFRAFINMVIVLSIRKFLVENGQFAPNLLVVDSPLLSLEQGVDEYAPESMKAALINYIMKNQEDGQTIIIENKIPELNYSDFKVNLIEFTKGKKPGRYGLLSDVKV